jgi:hypothetical protein
MSSDDEAKASALRQEKYEEPRTDNGSYDCEAFDEIEEKKLIRKIDWRLLPILGALYSIALIDRTNVSSL